MKSQNITPLVKSSKYHVANLDRGLDVLELLKEQMEGLTLSDIMRMLSISKNLAFRVTSTLLERGYIERNSRTMLFRLSRKLLKIGLSAEANLGLVEAAIPFMHELRDLTSETVVLCVHANDRGLVLHEVPSTQMMCLTIAPGTEYAIHASAQGKAILAAMPENKAIEFLQRIGMPALTPTTLTTIEQFLEEFALIRKRGYGYDLQENFSGVFCVGAAVFDRDGFPIAGLSVVSPSFRIPVEDYEQRGQLVYRYAQLISERLGFHLRSHENSANKTEDVQGS